MIYENEELRLKTININAEIERGQSDIKKLKRENEMLKKEIWCLRDEYDKLDRLLKDKKIDFSSSSTTCSSDSESCSSCTEESEEVETSQNLENVQKTNLENIHREFDHLSVVPEENSTENSDKTSNRASLPNDQWNYEKDVIQPDQSYPSYQNLSKSQTLPSQEKMPSNFFSPIKVSKSYDENRFNQAQQDTLYPEDFYENSSGNYPHNIDCPNYVTEKSVNTNAPNFFQNMVLVPKTNKIIPQAETLDKSSTDLMVKIDNCNFDNRHLVFSNTPSQSTFSNGGNLEELLNDIESISQDILKISNLQRPYANFNGTDEQEPDYLTHLRREDIPYNQNPENLVSSENEQDPSQKPYKSELNVVLMPNPMPLIGFDKYRNIQRSFESINSRTLEEMSASQQNLCVLPPVEQQNQPFPQPETPMITITQNSDPSETNPFFFGNIKDNYINSDYFNVRYNPENFSVQDEERQKELINKTDERSNSKINLLEVPSSDHVSSENEENLKFKTTKSNEKPVEATEKAKSPKLSIRRKVSIHFKGKKDKNKKLSLDTSEIVKPKTPQEKKHSLFDIRFNDIGNKDKQNKTLHQKTPSMDSKKSATEVNNAEPKTPTSSDSKNSNCDKKNMSATDKKDTNTDKKNRNSVSVSPDRSKHVHVKEEGKKHKKHKRSDRFRNRRSTCNSIDVRNLRERSFSVCTDRSNMLGLGLGSGILYDDYSDRERTNSLSSCETVNTNRKMSGISNVQLSGKVPWCACWGNGCL